MTGDRPIPVAFFRLDSGREPVRGWLKALALADRKAIGEDIKTLQFGWPVGMPLARKMARDLKKSDKTPAKELSLAKRRLSKLRT